MQTLCQMVTVEPSVYLRLVVINMLFQVFRRARFIVQSRQRFRLLRFMTILFYVRYERPYAQGGFTALGQMRTALSSMVHRMCGICATN